MSRKSFITSMLHVLCGAALFVFSAVLAAAQGDQIAPRLKFNNATLEIVLEEYAARTGRTLLLGPGLPKASITLRSQSQMTMEEYLDAIESVLAMHGVAVLPVDDKFIKVVPVAQARQEEMEIRETLDEELADSGGRLVSQLIPLQHIEIAEVKKAIEPLKHPYGQIHLFERNNSLLLTDTAANVNRILQIISFLDQPKEAREEPNVVQIRFAKAADIKKKLEEIIAESQEDKEQSTVPQPRQSGAPGVASRVTPGIIRARALQQQQREAPSVEELIELAERGIITGRVQIIADERTNILIIITRPENMKFFEKIIRVLDVETAPDVVVRVLRLEFAEAKTVAEMLNDLIGAASEDENRDAATTGGEGAATESTSAALRDFIERQRAVRQEQATKSKVGELSKENIKILSDERTNSLIIMASRSDVATLEEIVRDMDMMLSQVLVEAVILEVSLDDSIETGIDWIQRSLIAYDESSAGARSPVVAFAGGGGAGSQAPRDATSFTSPSSFPAEPSAGLTYYLTFFDLNLDVLVRMVASDSRTRILSSPVILTTDNTEATIDVATERYFYKGKKYAGSAGGDPIYEDDVERQSVGIALKVTPRINEKKFVVMELEQTIDNVSGVQRINDTEWPIVTTRKLEADVAVRSGDTVVLGGLVQNSDGNTQSKVPILGDIPLLGYAFKSKRRENVRTEVIVFITPYVLDTPLSVREDATRRMGALNVKDMWQRGWSDSDLAAPHRALPEDEPGEKTAIPEAAAPEDEEAAAPAREEAAGGLGGLDPETAEFIRREDARWDGVLDDIDKRVDSELGR